MSSLYMMTMIMVMIITDPDSNWDISELMDIMHWKWMIDILVLYEIED